MDKSVYIETSVISYLTARPSRDIVQAAHQEITRGWWQRRNRYELFVSGLVLQEVSAGDPAASVKRVEALRDVRVLDVTEEAIQLGEKLLRHTGLPPNARLDALHIAVAIVSGLEYLLTWNCTHIANATIRGKIEVLSRALGYEPPIICTPEELVDEQEDD